MIGYLMMLAVTIGAVVFGFIAFLIPSAAIMQHFGVGWGMAYLLVAISLYLYKAELHYGRTYQ